MPSSDTPELIKRKLSASLAAIHVEVLDESDRHAGHAGARGGGGHYALIVVSDAFEGRPSLERHRLVYAALSEEMSVSIHALALRTLTPAEWRENPGG